ncbi:MAG: hypothetical protein PHX55_06455 [Eubacteriales bacterium]|nr:hypothetical protein [Eubacteriales bacterium]MDD3867239.1 hypothetical protein [Eubacteriales bacterium]
MIRGTVRPQNRRRGSISLLLALLLPTLATLLALLALSVQTQAGDAAIARAMSAQIRDGLSRYERPLLDTFGLFAFRPEVCDRRVFDHYLPDIEPGHVNLIAQKPLLEPAELESRIIAFMEPRLPFAWIERIMRTTGCLSADGGPSGLSGVTGWLSALSTKEQGAAREGLFSGLIDQVEDESADWLSRVYRESAASLAGIPDHGSSSSLSGHLVDFFDPQAVSDVLRSVEQLLSPDSPALYEKLCLADYVLGCFGRSVDQVWLQGGCQPIRMIDGRPMSELPSERRAEAEQILTGIDQPKLAILVTKTAITSVRALFHLLCQLLDQETMATIRGTAAALSAAIAAASAGSVVVDPEMLTWLVVAGRSLQKGWTDTRKLCKGYAVAIWPDEAVRTPDLFYEDYLRLFLLVQPRPRLVEQTGRRLSAWMPGPFFCGLRIETDWRGQRLALEGNYP